MTFYRREIVAAASEHGLDSDLVQAVVEQESSGVASAYRFEPAFFQRYLATNPRYRDRIPQEVSASYGLMQVMYTTAIDHGFTGQPWELFAPAVSLHYGCLHLASLVAWARSLYIGLETEARDIITRSALAAFNGGKAGNKPLGPLRNREYADKVLVRYRRIRGEATP